MFCFLVHSWHCVFNIGKLEQQNDDRASSESRLKTPWSLNRQLIATCLGRGVGNGNPEFFKWTRGFGKQDLQKVIVIIVVIIYKHNNNTVI